MSMIPAKPRQLWSQCGVPIQNRSQAIAHAATCCSVGIECTDDKCTKPNHQEAPTQEAGAR